jgi:hypothetical protein
MSDGYITMSHMDVVELARKYSVGVRAWGFSKYMRSHRDDVQYEYLPYGMLLETILWVFTPILIVFCDDPLTFVVKMVSKGIIRPRRDDIDADVRRIVRGRIISDNMISFVSASKKYGEVTMSIENYKSVRAMIDFKCPYKTLKKRLSELDAV